MKIYKAFFLLFIGVMIQSCMVPKNVGYCTNYLTDEEKREFTDSMNYYRASVGVPPVKYSFIHEQLPMKRIQTIFEHLRETPEEEIKKDGNYHHHFGIEADSKSYFDSVPLYNVLWSENVIKGFTLYHKIDLFKEWKSSPKHWENMMKPEFRYISLCECISSKSGFTLVVLSLFSAE